MHQSETPSPSALPNAACSCNAAAVLAPRPHSRVPRRRRQLLPRPTTSSSSAVAAAAVSVDGASEFRRRAAAVGAAIAHASTNIARLAHRTCDMAKTTSPVFDDPSVEIHNLAALIKRDLSSLNAAVSDLHILFHSQTQRPNTSCSTSHSGAIVDSLKTSLMNAAKEFKQVLTTNTKSLRAHQNRRKIFSSSASGDMLTPSSIAMEPPESSIPPAPWATDSASTTPLFQRKRNTGDVGLPLSRPFMQQQQIAVQQDSFMQSRAEAIQDVESTIHELSNIFAQLATMVSQQGELAVRIDDNMDDMLANVDGAQGQLVKHLSSISSNRWLMTKIFILLMVFLLIFLLFVV
ncbi:hypothetical protein ACP4OV_006790 [Aristida adscensionis]